MKTHKLMVLISLCDYVDGDLSTHYKPGKRGKWCLKRHLKCEYIIIVILVQTEKRKREEELKCDTEL